LIYNSLPKLEKLEIIEKENVPPGQLISLFPYAPVEYLLKAEMYRTEIFLEKNGFIKVFMQDVIRSAGSLFFALLIFGSYSKGTNDDRSDLDLLAIVPERKHVSQMEEAIKDSYTKMKKDIIVVTEDDFLEMTANSDRFNVGNEARKNHVILYGFEQYHRLIEKLRR